MIAVEELAAVLRGRVIAVEELAAILRGREKYHADHYVPVRLGVLREVLAAAGEVRVARAELLVAVDPGLEGCGVATFADAVLERASFVRSSRVRHDPRLRAADAATAAIAVGKWVAAAPGDLAVEWPRVYATAIRRGERGADPNDLLALAGVAAAVVTTLPDARAWSYAPSEWKGQLPKAACHVRVRSRLSPAELAVAAAAAAAAGRLGHNVLDAVGVGLHHLGRLARRRAR